MDNTMDSDDEDYEYRYRQRRTNNRENNYGEYGEYEECDHQNYSEEDLDIAEEMYGRDSRAYRKEQKRYNRLRLSHYYRHMPAPYTSYAKKKIPRTPIMTSVNGGIVILSWILEERSMLPTVQAQIIIAYVDHYMLEHIFDKLEKLRLL